MSKFSVGNRVKTNARGLVGDTTGAEQKSKTL